MSRIVFGKAARLKRLVVDEISSVTRGANSHARVMIRKRSNFRNEERDYSPAEARQLAGNSKQEADMSSKYVCPECGHVDDKSAFKDAAAGYDDGDDGDEMDKRHPLDTVRKAAIMTHDSIVKSFRERMPAASESEVLAAAVNSPEYMALHRDERDAAFRSQGFL